MKDLLVVGHLCIDFVAVGDEPPRMALGGPPAYTSMAAVSFGASTASASVVGTDFPREYIDRLSSAGVDLRWLSISGSKSTSYLLSYACGERRLRLLARAPPITPDLLPREAFRSAHVSPVVGEVSLEVVKTLRGRVEVLSLDPQGFVRGFDDEGFVRGVSWPGRRFFGFVDVLKVSPEELRLAVGGAGLSRCLEEVHGAGVSVVLITLGSRGSLASFSDGVYLVPACTPRRVVDETGAGDAYMGAFLAHYVRGAGPLWCACVGSASASLVVEACGPVVVDGDEALRRAENAYGRVRRLSPRDVDALGF
ncbi:MAG TPA: hypothetical protein ENF62_00800 [Candidatus Bathyarchaeota archaeon]|nr:hypothetical protein [Candidatus Bathyarchaeota archaeon]